MDPHSDIREFLTTRRARLTPAQVGLPDVGRRRVPGLRRAEVAVLAGVSVEYYVRLERGDAAGVSESVLDGLGAALRLDDAERSHLDDLVRAANAGARRRRGRPRPQQVRSGVQQLLDAMRDVPALVQDGRLDVLAANDMGRAVFAPMFSLVHVPAGDGGSRRVPNFGRFLFLDPRARGFYRDWDDAAHQTVALLRAEAGRVPHDHALGDLVAQLSTRSTEFAALWASHDVREHRTGTKSITHPVVGDLDLSYEALNPTTDPGLLLIAYTAEPGSPSSDGLRMLASWAATTRNDVTDATREGQTAKPVE